jgi:hypothetical protein
LFLNSNSWAWRPLVVFVLLYFYFYFCKHRELRIISMHNFCAYSSSVKNWKLVYS